MFKIGPLRIGKEAGIPLSACSNSTSSRTGLIIGTGAVGGVKPVFPGGLDIVRPEGRTLILFERDLVFREAFGALRIAGVTEHMTYIYASSCPGWPHVSLTLRDEIQDHVASIDS